MSRETDLLPEPEPEPEPEPAGYTDVSYSSEMTVSAARAQVLQHRRNPDGIKCPVCSRLCKVYQRRLNASMCLVLILLARRLKFVAPEFVHVPSFVSGLPFSARVLAAIRGDWAKLKYWGFLEPYVGNRGDGSRRNGYYRVTERGAAFVRGGVRASESIFMTGGAMLGESDETVDITAALGRRYNYAQLMTEGVPAALEPERVES